MANKHLFYKFGVDNSIEYVKTSVYKTTCVIRIPTGILNKSSIGLKIGIITSNDSLGTVVFDKNGSTTLSNFYTDACYHVFNGTLADLQENVWLTLTGYTSNLYVEGYGVGTSTAGTLENPGRVYLAATGNTTKYITPIVCVDNSSSANINLEIDSITLEEITSSISASGITTGTVTGNIIRIGSDKILLDGTNEKITIKGYNASAQLIDYLNIGKLDTNKYGVEIKNKLGLPVFQVDDSGTAQINNIYMGGAISWDADAFGNDASLPTRLTYLDATGVYTKKIEAEQLTLTINDKWPGDVTGTVNGTAVGTLTSNATSGAAAYTGTAAYRNNTYPTNNAAFGTITQTQTLDANTVVTIPYTYTQGAVLADQLFIYTKEGGGSVSAADPCISTNAVSGSIKFTLKPSTTYTFGIQAVRRTESGLFGTSILTSGSITTSASEISGIISTWGATNGGIPGLIASAGIAASLPPTGSGFKAYSNYLGYYSNGSWKTYMDMSGKFGLVGDGTNYLSWNGNALQIKGNIVMDSGSIAWSSITGPDYTNIGGTKPPATANETYIDSNGLIQGVSNNSAGTAVNNTLLETTRLINNANTTVSGNTITKTSGGNTSWDASAISKDGFTGGAYVSAVATSKSTHIMFGLNTDPTTDNSFGSIDYAIYFTAGTLVIYESGSSIGSFGSYSVGDVASITYDGFNVKYFLNGVLLRTVAASITNPIHFDSSLYEINSKLTNVNFGPMPARYTPTWINSTTIATGKSAFTDTVAGFYVDSTSGGRLHVGNSTNYVKFDGTTLSIAGNVSMSSGSTIAWSNVSTSGTPPSNISNASITMNSNGTLSGAGSGQVTISGLGYTGDIDATKGATWGVNLGGIPGTIMHTSTYIDGNNVFTGNVYAENISGNTIKAVNLSSGSITTAGAYLTQATNLNDTTIYLSNIEDFSAFGGEGWILDGFNDKNYFTWSGINTVSKTLTGCSGVQAHTFITGLLCPVIPRRPCVVMSNRMQELRVFGYNFTNNNTNSSVEQLFTCGIKSIGDTVVNEDSAIVKIGNSTFTRGVAAYMEVNNSGLWNGSSYNIGECLRVVNYSPYVFGGWTCALRALNNNPYYIPPDGYGGGDYWTGSSSAHGLVAAGTGYGVWAESGTSSYASSIGAGVYGRGYGNAIGGKFYSNTGYGISTQSGTNIGTYSNGYTYDFYAAGVGANYGPFTGAHDALIGKNENTIPGDIVCDESIINKSNISNCISNVIRSSKIKDKRILGVIISTANFNDDLVPSGLKLRNETDEILDYNEIAQNYNLCIVNALGEGQINVCKEGGNIEAGDYICSSSRAGKGMKQDDDLLHNYTVAKARESCVWEENEDDIRMIACTYHCG